jgi:ABC-type transporter Mla MlaB component
MTLRARRRLCGNGRERAEHDHLCHRWSDRARGLLDRSGAGVAFCDVAGVSADAVAVDALARLQLAARRHRCLVRLQNASAELRALVAFMGLADVLVE